MNRNLISVINKLYSCQNNRDLYIFLVQKQEKKIVKQNLKKSQFSPFNYFSTVFFRDKCKFELKYIYFLFSYFSFKYISF